MAGSVRRTEGVEDTLSRPGLVNRALMGIAEWAQGLNEKYSKLRNRPVYDVAEFPWAADVEREWHHIRAELDALLTRKEELPGCHEILSELRSISTDRDWKSFVFACYGAKSNEAIRQCPQTWRVLQTIPGMKTAIFSVLEPGKHLKPHRGPYNGVLRLHLGLLVPDAPPRTVAIRVDDTVCHWEEGKVLIFDDCYEHEAWNQSNETRVVLFVDFVKPLRFPASFVNRLILNIAAFTPFIREGKKAQKKWEEGFYGNGSSPATAAPIVAPTQRSSHTA
ncbi:aspartyl/asparaginyl beta-hydroxylase domain-containing protein [Mycobacterium triplex]|uniref:Aspartyl/asparaginyl beta-hydroxylase-like dioxygenase n=1 Tax=Mycobacterium triplex TaxID=47839 RepID=A0A024K3P9_9MYCO|nr:aspartyl/asparaginyl beta-hydroxylase domain-containing protein [Mycobacterium triplex]CDO90675.1 aspartyl/asparaginyl beta-hydroxylase-like dioxygenase [Mycobacterium triplex]